MTHVFKYEGEEDRGCIEREWDVDCKKIRRACLVPCCRHKRGIQTALCWKSARTSISPFQSAEKAATFYWHIWQLLFPSPLLPKKLLWWRKKVCPDISLQNSADFFFAPAISGEERVVKIAKQKFFFIFGGNISGHFKVGPVSRDTLFCPSFSGASLWETGGKGSGKKSLIRVRDAYFFSTKTEAALLEIILLTSPSSPPFFIRAISW